MERPRKRAKLLADDSRSRSSNDETDGQEQEPLRINAEFAKRFEHNKKREELHRLREKYTDDGDSNGVESAADTDSESQSEDDAGELVTEEIDAEWLATLNALRSKDPGVYDPERKFYKELDEDKETASEVLKPKEKPVYLRDYHRKNLLEGAVNSEKDEAAPKTYVEEQESLKRDLVQQIHAVVTNGNDDHEDDEEENNLLVPKAGSHIQPKVGTAVMRETDIAAAENDPEGFLTKFMASRAWVPGESSKYPAFESEDDDEEDRADAIEQAYNLRFEDPQRANVKLASYSREVVAEYSVRREEAKGRKRFRDAERAKKDAERKKRDEEKARLRKLKLEEAQDKLLKFKEAAGLGKQSLSVDEWSKFLEAGWDSDKWDKEMAERFGDSYYAKHAVSEDDEKGSSRGNKRVRKPKWEDEIDINDIVPSFDEEEHRITQGITLSDEDEGNPAVISAAQDGIDSGSRYETSDNATGKREYEKSRSEYNRNARKERQTLEEWIDRELVIETIPPSSRQGGPYRYRDTSPSSFGLSAREILMADDSQLNQFAGLKKLATFREDDKKSKDKKRLGKRARLRKWRKDTFGDETGPNISFQEYLAARLAGDDVAGGVATTSVNGRRPHSKKKQAHR